MWYQTGPLIKHKLSLPQGHSTLRGIADNVNPTPRQLSERKKIDPLALGPKTPEEIIQDVKRRYGSVLRAIRSVHHMRDGRLGFRDFCICYEKLGYSREVRSIWFLLNKNLSKEISIEQLDPEAFRLLKYFHETLTQKYGSLYEAWRYCLDYDGREVVPFRFFVHTVQSQLGLTHAEADLLFKCLDLNSLGHISYDEIAFLDDWACSERRSSRRRGDRWLNRDPAGVVDWDTRPDLDVGSAVPSATPREISMVPQVSHHHGSLPSTARNLESGRSEIARGFSLSPQVSWSGRRPGQTSARKQETIGKLHLPAIK